MRGVVVKPEWQGQAAVIIGGGSSLKDYPFRKLTGLNTVGVNEAFRLGPKICKACLFGDIKWWEKVKWELEAYALAGGKVYSISPPLDRYDVPHVIQLQRINDGLHKGHLLGWNWSSGAAAINLARNLGATRIYLLGFDLSQNKDGRSHWHVRYSRPTMDDSFIRFQRGFKIVADSLKRFKEVEVFNVTDGTSKLNHFPRINFAEFERMVWPRSS